MSKYYTPELEEFHVGFEYYHATFKDQELSKYIVDDSYDFSTLKEEIIGEVVRVKYLDRKDIESLWGKINEWVIPKSGGSYRLILHTRLNLPFERTITIEMKNHVRDGSGDYTVLPVLYRIKVKNKSEFRKLLKQIGYESKGI